MRAIPVVLAALFTTSTASAQVPISDVVATLTPRHAGADCEALAQLGEPDDVLGALITTANTVAMPPWVGTRAAHCVAEEIDRTPKALAAAESWLGNADTAGFALIVLGELPHLSAPTADRLRTAVQPRLQADPTFAAHARPLLRTPSDSSDSSVRTP